MDVVLILGIILGILFVLWAITYAFETWDEYKIAKRKERDRRDYE